jgi:antirestriction protein
MPYLCFEVLLRFSRYSLLPALAMDGIIYHHIKPGSFDGDSFQEFLEGLLKIMNPYPAEKSVLVMDNCAIHHVEGVAEMCAER